ncbi:MAG: ParB/RepB/Spo0J family partition protein, partial [Eubacterium sp.]|nr:ParB/RepB/Spo0J family partition protein [Eubacterium sp.]
MDISHIKTEKLLPNPYQPRRRFESEDMLSLADSIKENGVLQPLLIRRINNSDYFEVIAGERRLRASILAGLEKVPCIEVDCGYEESAVFSILENIQRCDLSFFEEAAAVGQLIDHFGMTQSECAKRLGKSQSALSNKLRLLKLPVDVRYFIEKEGLTERHARALLKLEGEKDIWAALNIIKEKGLNVEQTERFIENLTAKPETVKKNVVKIYRDVRIFVNTVNRAIETMK